MIKKAALCLLLLLSSVTYAQHQPAYEGVSIPNKNVTLSGTLTIPAADKPVPAVVLISGSGPHDRDETMMGKKPFLVIAEYLTRRGIAVLRYDDRGTHRSTGNYAQSTIPDFAADAQAAFDFLKKYPGIDPEKIGILGHSEGAMIGQVMVAGEKSAAFFVSLAGPGQNGDLLMKEQSAQHFKSLSEKEVKAQMAMLDTVLQIVKDENDTLVMQNRLRNLFGDFYDNSPATLTSAISKEDLIKRGLVNYTRVNFKAILQHDPAKFFPHIKCPVLAINGDKDTQVACDTNLKAWNDGLAAAGNKKVTVKSFPGLNHLFQHCKTCTMFEYGQLPETISPEVLAYIQAWIAVQTGLKKS
ncbi:alpha/beta hydrolase family protein [Chitinophaga sp. GCM10012297]|uniref:Alpha/beta hydrolase n=1 Tax=Chitinophaga chungangae TaxID=2821488 RepID=A0ABS3Y9Q1_9BACT|nr:alpha/beta hydrolase [Chitinophaga chungangae]MBO9151399.1 alpha/beta hydrolase [Chitinophaga chungangae]